jgi:flagellar basal body rod protein FlgB
MLYGFFGRVSQSDRLKQALDVGSQRTRLIADRVAKATLQAGADGFALPEAQLRAGALQEGPIDLESEMVSLADEQLHYEATAKLLEKTYQQIRSSLRDR